MESDEAEARDRLLQAIKDVDAAKFGPRPANEILTNYAVVYAHRRVDEEPDKDADGLARITMPGQALWQTTGLLETELLHIRAEIAFGIPDDEEGPGP